MHHHTPVETYSINGVQVDVKRDDLFAEPPYPPNAKMRGIRPLMEGLKAKGVLSVGVFDTRISEASWIVALEAKRLWMRCITYYPKTQYEPRSLKHVLEAGGEVEYVRHNVTPVCYSEAARHAGENSIHMLPFGLSVPDTVVSVANEVANTIRAGYYKSVVVCSGSGTTLAGLLYGFGTLPHFYAISAGASLGKQYKALRRLLAIHFLTPISFNIIQVPRAMDYYDACDFPCPFDSNPFYDRKSWKWLVENIKEIERPCLFWNIGGWRE